MKTSFAGNRPFPRQKRGRREFSWSQESHLSVLLTPAALGWIIPGKQTVLFIQEASQLSLENTVSAREAHVQKRLCNYSLIEHTQEKNWALGENVFYGISRNIRILGREKRQGPTGKLVCMVSGLTTWYWTTQWMCSSLGKIISPALSFPKFAVFFVVTG